MATFTGDITVASNDVFVATGVSHDAYDLIVKIGQAAATIELITGVFNLADEREVAISVADAAWIKRAIIYQTVWNIENPDALSRTGVSSLSQDGISVSAPNELTFVLAPLAKRALNNCSWAKSGTLKVALADPSEAKDFLVSDNHVWSPLGAV